MGQAPRPRDMRSTFGKSLGVAVQGIMPETYRNRSKPDPANQSGSPWPDAAEVVTVLFNDHDSGTLTGTSDSFALSIALPAEGLWLLTPRFDVSGNATADAGEAAVLDVELNIPSVAPFYQERHVLARNDTGSTMGLPVSTTVSFAYPYRTNLFGGTDLTVEATARIGHIFGYSVADWADADVFIDVRCVRLATEWTST